VLASPQNCNAMTNQRAEWIDDTVPQRKRKLLSMMLLIICICLRVEDEEIGIVEEVNKNKTFIMQK
jgi:hypothetical protein